MTTVIDSVAARFAELFVGRTDVAGRHDPSRPAGQQTWTDRTTVTEDDYRAHLEGKKSLGVFPLRDDGTVRWTCFDVDTQDPSVALRIRTTLTGYGLQPWLERTKTKGYHVWVFWHADVRAEEVRRFARQVLTESGAPLSTEVFPKQGHLFAGQVGNFVNLPYEGRMAAEGRRVMISDDGAVIPLVEFLSLAKPSLFPEGFASHARPVAPPKGERKSGFRIGFGDRGGSYDGPPPSCVTYAMNTDPAEYTMPGEPLFRNETASRFVGFWHGLAGLDDDETLEKVQEWNSQLSDPLDDAELESTVRKVIRGGYSYGCAKIREIKAFADGCSWSECPLYHATDTDDSLPVVSLPVSTEGLFHDARNSAKSETTARVTPAGEEKDDGDDELKMVSLLAHGWLRDYVSFGRTVTDAPRLFHLAGGLAVLAAGMGNKVKIRTFGVNLAHPNIYIVVMCPSGFYRKSTVGDIAQRVLEYAAPGRQLPDVTTPELFLSQLAEEPARILFSDEFGGMLAQWNKREYLSGMKVYLTSLFDRQRFRKGIKGTKGTGEIEEIEGAAITLFGTTTVDWLQDAMKIEDLRAGLASRILWVWARHKEPSKDDWPWDTEQEIARLGDYVASLASLERPAMANFDRVRKPFFDWIRGYEDQWNRTGIDAEISGVVARSGVYVQKIATILAVSDEQPVNDMVIVRREHLDRAIAWVEWCVERQRYMVTEQMQFNDYEKARNRLRDAVERAGGRLPYHTATRILARKRREVNEVIETMVAAQYIRVVAPAKKNSPGRPGKVICFPDRVRDGEVDVA